MTNKQYDIPKFLATWPMSTWEMTDLQTVFCAGPDLVMVVIYAPETGTRVAFPFTRDQARQLAKALKNTADVSDRIRAHKGEQS